MIKIVVAMEFVYKLVIFVDARPIILDNNVIWLKNNVNKFYVIVMEYVYKTMKVFVNVIKIIYYKIVIILLKNVENIYVIIMEIVYIMNNKK